MQLAALLHLLDEQDDDENRVADCRQAEQRLGDYVQRVLDVEVVVHEVGGSHGEGVQEEKCEQDREDDVSCELVLEVLIQLLVLTHGVLLGAIAGVHDTP